jgi:hypothetical protein
MNPGTVAAAAAVWIVVTVACAYGMLVLQRIPQFSAKPRATLDGWVMWLLGLLSGFCGGVLVALAWWRPA